MNDRSIHSTLNNARTIAIVGISDKPERDSYRVGAYLKEQGYQIIPVNPAVGMVLGQVTLGSLREIKVPAEIVDVFRRPETMMSIVEDATAIGAKTVWMQLGIVNEEAANRARSAGLTVVMDRCIMIEHRSMR